MISQVIAVALLTALSGIIIALIKRNETIKAKQLEQNFKELKEENLRLKADKAELLASFNALEIVTDLKFFNIINDKVGYIFKNTDADRFLILFAINGKTEFNFVNAIYEEHKQHDKLNLSSGAVSKYMNVRIDSEYKTLLKRCENEGSVCLEVAKMNNSLLKDYYVDEGVTHSMVNFISRLSKDVNNDIIIYCTVATHGEAYSERDKNIINLGVSGIQAASNNLVLRQKDKK